MRCRWLALPRVHNSLAPALMKPIGSHQHTYMLPHSELSVVFVPFPRADPCTVDCVKIIRPLLGGGIIWSPYHSSTFVTLPFPFRLDLHLNSLPDGKLAGTLADFSEVCTRKTMCDLSQIVQVHILSEEDKMCFKQRTIPPPKRDDRQTHPSFGREAVVEREYGFRIQSPAFSFCFPL